MRLENYFESNAFIHDEVSMSSMSSLILYCTKNFYMKLSEYNNNLKLRNICSSILLCLAVIGRENLSLN